MYRDKRKLCSIWQPVSCSARISLMIEGIYTLKTCAARSITFEHAEYHLVVKQIMP